ncbi:uncharacterized protein LOC111267692 [Varroa jacobsoni]|uniref:Uncharacterized protein n=1 Tax=Varroa destructor TaxID=109461 RepID=A0A7M7J258_VARDE|nr:uncharacterized protein LOC111243521 [Varroa destructor]XP_022701834.1 uncharacterized protein LOC111267692 [Varroa jacobsoni]XP_022701835.1 uncharacterized protein LOC111267692 [Varroa jacobsoni]
MFGATERGPYTANACKIQPKTPENSEPEMELASADMDRRRVILDELKSIVTSILTGRISPLTLTMLSMRYADVKGFTIPFRRLGCVSLVEVFQKHFADEIACSYMHYYKDYVVWIKNDVLSRDTVIDRLRRYALCAQHHPQLQRSPGIRKTLFKKPSANLRTLFSGKTACAVTCNTRVAKLMSSTLRIAVDVQARQPQSEKSGRTSDPTRSTTGTSDCGQYSISRSAKRRLSTDTSLILPVQRMRITDDPEGLSNENQMPSRMSVEDCARV